MRDFRLTEADGVALRGREAGANQAPQHFECESARQRVSTGRLTSIGRTAR
jgi:hypothetical protein